MNGKSENGASDHLPSVVERLVEIQSADIELRKDELASQERINAKELEHAQKVIQTQVQAQDNHGKKVLKLRQMRYLLFGFLAIIIAVVFIYYKDQPAITGEIIKTLGLLVGGFMGGYGYAQSRKNQPEP